MNKLLRLILILIVGQFFVYFSANAYEIDTHAALTQEVFKFYNKNFIDNKIPNELKDYLIDGSRREDDPPRFKNHFYDPVYNRGLTSSYANGLKSKDWAQNSNEQASLKYNPTIGTVLASIQSNKIEKFLPTSDYSWGEAVRYYVNGEPEMAMFALGHILHLLEDTSVPDHTRNDPHPTGGPYERWALQFTTKNLDLSKKLNNKKPVELGSLNSYFDELAKYSNNNFYSKDSIGIGEYKSPEPDYFTSLGDVDYGFKNDNEFGDYHLVQVVGGKNFGYLTNLRKNLTLVDPENLILQDYWNRLSVKSVQYGAGVVDLFFKEVEKAKNDPNFVRERKKSFLGQAVAAINDFVGGLYNKAVDFVKSPEDRGFVEVSSVPRAPADDSETQAVVPKKHNKKKNGDVALEPKLIERIVVSGNVPNGDISKDKNVDEEIDKIKSDLESQLVKDVVLQEKVVSLAAASVPSQVTRSCRFKDGESHVPSHAGVILNEVAWMGSSKSASDEWMELKNIAGGVMDLSGWQIIDREEQVKITLSKNTKLAANNFFLLERTDDNTVPGIKADLIYVGSLANSNEALRLFDENCVLIDDVSASPDWPAGDSIQKRTMESRGNPSTSSGTMRWYTHQGLGSGTPKAENSEPPVVSVVSSGGGFSPSPATVSNPVVSITTNSVAVQNCTSTNQSVQLSPVFINEVAWMGTLKSSSDEWIELKNISDSDVQLTNWQLLDKDREIKVVFGSIDKIPAHGLYLLERTGDDSVPGVLANKIYTGGLENADESLSLFDAGCALVDEVKANPNWLAGDKDARRSMEREENLSWVTYLGAGVGGVLGTPGQENNTTPPSSTASTSTASSTAMKLSQVKNFEANFISSSVTTILKWDPVSSTSYQVSFATEATTTIINTTSTSLSLNLKEVGAQYEFKIKAVSGTLESDYSTTTLLVPSFLNAVYFYPTSIQSNTYDVADLRYATTTFVPSLYSDGSSEYKYNLLVFYVNKLPGGRDVLSSLDNFNPGTSSLVFSYSNCSGGNSPSAYLLLPGVPSNCQVGGPLGGVLNPFYALPTRTTLYLRDLDVLKQGDYVTVAYYSRVRNLSMVPEFKLVAVDRQKFYFQTTLPPSEAPTMPQNFNAVLDATNTLANLSWDASTDPDSVTVSYELQVVSSTQSSTLALDDTKWKSINVSRYSNDPSNLRRYTVTNLVAGLYYKIAIRAYDEAKNYSPVAILDLFP